MTAEHVRLSLGSQSHTLLIRRCVFGTQSLIANLVSSRYSQDKWHDSAKIGHIVNTTVQNGKALVKFRIRNLSSITIKINEKKILWDTTSKIGK